MEKDSRPRKDNGQLKEQYTDDDFIEAVTELRIASAGDIADYVGCTNTTAKRRLRELAKQNKITGKKSGTGVNGIWIFSTGRKGMM